MRVKIAQTEMKWNNQAFIETQLKLVLENYFAQLLHPFIAEYYQGIFMLGYHENNDYQFLPSSASTSTPRRWDVVFLTYLLT